MIKLPVLKPLTTDSKSGSSRILIKLGICGMLLHNARPAKDDSLENRRRFLKVMHDFVAAELLLLDTSDKPTTLNSSESVDFNIFSDSFCVAPSTGII